MAKSNSKICRVCLEQLGESEHVHFLNNDNGLMLLSKLLDFLPEIDLDFVRNPISCNQCTITINQMHEFKNLCVQTESVLKELKQQRKSFNDVISYMKNATEIQMIKEEILEDKVKDEYTINMAESVSKVCRICLEQLGENKPFYFLNNDNGLMLLSNLLDFLPEIDLDFVQNPISCNRCTVIIDEIHWFKKLFMQTESVIKDLKKQQKSFDDVISHVKKDTEIETIKEEFLQDKFKNEPLIADDDCLQINTDLAVFINVPTKLLFYCYTCDYTTYHKRYLARHVNIHRLHAFKCDQCSYTISNNSSLTTHKQSHLKIKPYQCNICNNCYAWKNSLNAHLRTHTGNCQSNIKSHVKKPYKCNVCDYSCARKNNLKLHLRTHTGEKPYTCDSCDYRCNRKSNLTLHIRNHTGEKRHKCDVCDYSSNQKSDLKRHTVTHTGEKQYKCDVCDYRCSHKSNLKQHIRKHTGEKRYKCDVCDYGCNQKSDFKRHTVTHTGEKQYKCDVCDFQCNQKSNLTLHIRNHSGEKRYKCDVCDYRSNYMTSIKRHTFSHTGEKLYKCDVCDYGCTKKKRLKIHIQTHQK